MIAKYQINEVWSEFIVHESSSFQYDHDDIQKKMTFQTCQNIELIILLYLPDSSNET